LIVTMQYPRYDTSTRKVIYVPRIYNTCGDKNPNYKTGLAIHGSRPSLYNSWCGMKARCLNPASPKYARYGGRGITVCDEWKDITGFYAWAIEAGWKQGLSIDRIDTDGNYCPENCRWITMSENSRKKRTTKLTMQDATSIRLRLDDGENAHALAKEYGVTHGTVWFIQKRFTHVPEGECTKRIKERNNMKETF